MISGFEVETAPLTRDERNSARILGEYISRYPWWFTADALAKVVGWKPGKSTGARIRKVINHIRREGVLIIASSKGYKIAQNRTEAIDYLEGLDQRISAIQAVRDALRKAMDRELPRGHQLDLMEGQGQ